MNQTHNHSSQASATKTAVILAGGRGTRLRPYTTSFPKPLMPVGEYPILEILIGQLAGYGFRDLHFAVGHLAELIRAYFGDGSKWNVRIHYSHEDTPLGTAGPLRVLMHDLPPQFLVMNGDILSDLDYGRFLDYHEQAKLEQLITISTHRRLLRSEYGVLEYGANGLIHGYTEKPSFPLSVSEGIYAFSHEALEWIAPGVRTDFPDLVTRLIKSGERVAACDHEGLWLDIGRPEDYARAQELYDQGMITPPRTAAGTPASRGTGAPVAGN